jgi:4-hydroxybenzoyl-CoA reductase subunit beta
MRLPHFEYVKPATLEEGLNVLQKSGKNARVLSGGTDLLINMKYRVVRPEVVIGVKSIPDLCRISSDTKGNTSIGAGVTLSDLASNTSLAEEFPAFNHAVKSVASKHIRNMASIGGNICLDTRCWYYNKSKLWRDSREVCHKLGGKLCHAIKGSERCHAINSSDTAPILITLDAKVKVAKKGNERVISIKDFFQDNGAQPTVLEPEEMVTSLLLPKNNGFSRTTFMKVTSRKGLDFAMGSIAVKVQENGNGLNEVRLVIGSIASAPIILKKAAQVVMESGLTEGAIEKAALTARSELGTLTNLFTSAGYKRHLAEVLVKRALLELGNLPQRSQSARRRK